MTVSQRKHAAPPASHDDRRQRLLDTARSLFSTRPYDEISADELVDRAGVAKGLLFYYFNSKRGLYLAVLEEAAEHLLTGAATHDQDPRRVLDAVLDTYLEFAESSEPVYRILVGGGIGADPQAREFAQRLRASWRSLLSAVFLPHDAENAALQAAIEGLLSYIEGATLHWLSERKITRTQLRALIIAATPAALTAATAADASVKLALTVFVSDKPPRLTGREPPRVTGREQSTRSRALVVTSASARSRRASTEVAKPTRGGSRRTNN